MIDLDTQVLRDFSDEIFDNCDIDKARPIANI